MGTVADLTLEQVYVRSRNRLALVAARYVGADADDLVHEAFLRAIRAQTTFRNRAQTTTWLHRIVVNACLDQCRQQHRRRQQTVPADPGVVKPASPARLTLRQVLRRLSPEDRQSYVLHDVMGYTHREIEERWAIPAGTSKSRLWRARRLLREALQPHGRYLARDRRDAEPSPDVGHVVAGGHSRPVP